MFPARYAGRSMRPSDSALPVAGLVLAAGAGSRFGGPKGLARTPEGEPWVARAVRTLRAGGCGQVYVTVGAEADQVAALIPPDVAVVRVDGWRSGLAASLRAGIEAVPPGTAILVATVDTPDMPAAAVARILATGTGEHALAQATYDGAPGHPALIGAGHAAAVAASVTGDRGARGYLAAHGALEVECGDLWSGADIDRR
jgi:CTP:molybdopterin cytidylyltransferase MocA